MKCLIFFRLTIASVDKDGKVTERKSSEIQKISLQKDEVTPRYTAYLCFNVASSLNI